MFLNISFRKYELHTYCVLGTLVTVDTAEQKATLSSRSLYATGERDKNLSSSVSSRYSIVTTYCIFCSIKTIYYSIVTIYCMLVVYRIYYLSSPL